MVEKRRGGSVRVAEGEGSSIVVKKLRGFFAGLELGVDGVSVVVVEPGGLFARGAVDFDFADALRAARRRGLEGRVAGRLGQREGEADVRIDRGHALLLGEEEGVVREVVDEIVESGLSLRGVREGMGRSPVPRDGARVEDGFQGQFRGCLGLGRGRVSSNVASRCRQRGKGGVS